MKYHSLMPPRFTKDTLKFLRALKRNNDREWFRSRKDEYERHVRAPMIAVIEQLAKDFPRVAPELVASPKASLFRIYRDTRFSADKSPLKTNAAAVFNWKGMARHQGAGLYFEVAPQWVWIGGGMYMPEAQQLVKVRQHIAETWPEIKSIATNKALVNRVSALHGDCLTRVPRGFPADHPAVEFLKYKQFLASREFPAEFAAADDFYPTLLATFTAMVPLVRFLNAPLTSNRGLTPRPLAAADAFAKAEAHDDHDGPLQDRRAPAHLQRLRGARARATAGEPGPSSRPHHYRHTTSGSSRRLRLRARADASHRRARRAWRPIRARVRDRTHHAAVARLSDDGPISARARLQAQRHARRLCCPGALRQSCRRPALPLAGS